MFEIPSYIAGLMAFLFVFAVMGIMYFILREEKEKTMPPLKAVGPIEVVSSGNPLASADAPFLGIITLVTLEVALDALIVTSLLEGVGSIAIGTMLAIAAFLAAAILAVYRSCFMGDAFMRRPRLERIAATISEETDEGGTDD